MDIIIKIAIFVAILNAVQAQQTHKSQQLQRKLQTQELPNAQVKEELDGSPLQLAADKYQNELIQYLKETIQVQGKQCRNKYREYFVDLNNQLSDMQSNIQALRTTNNELHCKSSLIQLQQCTAQLYGPK